MGPQQCIPDMIYVSPLQVPKELCVYGIIVTADMCVSLQG